MACDGVFNKLQTSAKMYLFFFVCIVIRLLLGSSIWVIPQLSKTASIITSTLILVFSLVSIWKLSMCLSVEQTVWWKRQFHLVTAIVLVIMSILSLAGQIEAKWMALVIWIDLIWGITHGIVHFA